MNKKSLLAQVILFVQFSNLGILASVIALSFIDVFPTPRLIVKNLVQTPRCNNSCKRITTKGAVKMAMALRKNRRQYYSQRKFF